MERLRGWWSPILHRQCPINVPNLFLSTPNLILTLSTPSTLPPSPPFLICSLSLFVLLFIAALFHANSFSSDSPCQFPPSLPLSLKISAEQGVCREVGIDQSILWVLNKMVKMGIFTLMTGIAGPSGFGSASTAEQVTDGIDASNLTAIVTG